MICPKCGKENANNTKFCVECGKALNVETLNNDQKDSSNMMNSNINNPNNSHNTNNVNKKALTQENNNEKMKYPFVILAVILKPHTAFKEELHKFSNLKNSIIMSVIISVCATLITLIQIIFNTVREVSYFSDEVTWNWDNLQELDFIQIIGRNFIVYLGIILAIAIVYYMASLVAKKQIVFSRILGIAATAIVPFLLGSLILAPVISLIYAPLSIVVSVIGFIYTVIILYETINSEISLEGNAKIYLNLICLSILVIVAYYLYVKLFMSGISLPGNTNDILDILGY